MGGGSTKVGVVPNQHESVMLSLAVFITSKKEHFNKNLKLVLN